MNTFLKQPLPRIAKILTVEPFRITALWTTAEIRQNDFEPLFEQWRQQEDSRLFPLFAYDTFKEVTLSPTRTFQWVNVPVKVELANRIIEGYLDLDPDELYRQSVLVRRAERLTV